MEVNKYKVWKVLRQAGLSDKEAAVFVRLVEVGSATPASLSRDTGINRTTVYRLLESLESRGLVSRELDQNSTRFKASDLMALERLMDEKIEDVLRLREEMSTVVEELQSLGRQEFPSAKVYYYKGIEGLKQLLWNTLKVGKGGEVVGLGYRTWNEGVGKKFAESLRQEYIEREIYSRELLNELQNANSFTGHERYLQSHYKAAIISEDVLRIRHDTYIYGDVFAFYYVRENEFFGVEIHNEEIANSQKQVFDILWEMAEKL